MKKLSERQRERIKAQMKRLEKQSLIAKTLDEQLLFSYDYEELDKILEKDSSNKGKQTQEDIWHLSQGWKKWWRK